MKNGILKIASLLVLGIVFSGCGSSASHQEEEREISEIINLADPTIFFEDGIYYLYGTGHSNRGFLVYTSTDGETWAGPKGTNNGFALREEDVFGNDGFWAPQVFEYQDKYYMAYTANKSIAIAESESPLGPFIQKEKKPLKAPMNQIDPFVFIDANGKRYLYHVRVANGGNKIFVAEIEDDFKNIKRETLTQVIEATLPWENIDKEKWSVTEGPSVLKHDQKYYLVYSANHFRNPDYAVGYAVSDSPMGPWEKYKGNPILRREDVGHNGTGHGDFFRNEEGKLFYVSHTHNSDSTVGPRKTAVVEASFAEPKNDKGPAQLRMDGESFHFLTVQAEQKKQ